MALKRKINKTAYDALSDELKAEYKANGDNYVLDVDDATDLINARDNANRERDAAKARVTELETENTALKKAGGDFSSIEEDYKKKIAKLEKDNGELNTTLTSERRDRYVKTEADKIAAKFTVPSLVVDKIAARLDIDPRDPKVVRVLGADGKASASTLADLEKEFVDNPEYKSIVIASKASGSAGSGLGGSAPRMKPPTDNEGKPRLFSQMTPAEIAEHRKAAREAETNT